MAAAPEGGAKAAADGAAAASEGGGWRGGGCGLRREADVDVARRHRRSPLSTHPLHFPARGRLRSSSAASTVGRFQRLLLRPSPAVFLSSLSPESRDAGLLLPPPGRRSATDPRARQRHRHRWNVRPLSRFARGGHSLVDIPRSAAPRALFSPRTLTLPLLCGRCRRSFSQLPRAVKQSAGGANTTTERCDKEWTLSCLPSVWLPLRACVSAVLLQFYQRHLRCHVLLFEYSGQWSTLALLAPPALLLGTSLAPLCALIVRPLLFSSPVFACACRLRHLRGRAGQRQPVCGCAG